MKGFTICSLTLLASLGSAQINVDSGSERIDITTGGGSGGNGDGDGVNTRFFTSGNTAIDSFIGAAAGTVVANVAGGLFNGYRDKCRFKRQAVDTKSQTDVDTRLICLDDLLPNKVDCNRCSCSDRECRDCYQCRQPDCYRCDCRQRDCYNYCSECRYNNGGGGRPWSSSGSSSGGSYRPQTQRPSYRPTTYRPPYNTGWRNGDDTKSTSSGGGVSFVNQ